MANPDTDLTVEGLHAAIVAAIKAKFPAFQTVEFYREDESERIATPACILNLVECDPGGTDGGTGEFPCVLRFEARIIMQVRSPVVALELRKAALALAAWLHQLGRFPGAPSDAIEVISAMPDDWMPANGGFRAWCVEFNVPTWLGVDAWADDGGVVPQSLFSFDPDIGAANVDKYTETGLQLP